MQRAGARCARPECLRETLGPSAKLSDSGQVLGVAAHIKAASPGGARFDKSQSSDERHSAKNGLWLCEFCGKLIDNNNGADFSVKQLSEWKIISEKAAYERLTKHSDLVRDNCLQTLIFINVPRLVHFIDTSQQNLEIPVEYLEGIPGDGYNSPELLSLRRAIGRIRFPALDWRDVIELYDDPTGILVCFEGQFRTKNGPTDRADRPKRDFSDYHKAPHVYAKNGLNRFVMPYDPRYVTTNTATSEFNRGTIRIGGFAHIKFRDGNDIVATPYVIGLASTPFARSLWNALSRE